MTPKRVLLLGYGALLRSLSGGVAAMAPDAALHGVKGSAEGLDALQAETPFPLSAGDGGARLFSFAPDAVLVAPPARLAPALCRDELAPYWQALRRRGRRPPLLLSFYTRPMDYAALLGPDAPAAVLLPGATQYAGGVPVGRWGRSLAWQAGPLSPTERVWAETLLAPSGPPVWVPGERLSGNLTVMVAAYLVQQLRTGCPPAQLRAALGLPALPGLPVAPPSDRARRTAGAFRAGLEDFIRAAGLCPAETEELLSATLQTCLCAAQAEPEEELRRRFQVCATPGGLLEAGANAWLSAPRRRSREIRAGARRACTAIRKRGETL